MDTQNNKWKINKRIQPHNDFRMSGNERDRSIANT